MNENDASTSALTPSWDIAKHRHVAALRSCATSASTLKLAETVMYALTRSSLKTALSMRRNSYPPSTGLGKDSARRTSSTSCAVVRPSAFRNGAIIA